MASECIFCKIARGEIAVPLLYEDEEVAAFRDINAQAPTHILIVPKQHIPHILQAVASDGHVLEKIFAAAAALARQEGIADSGFRVVVNHGADAGQTVQHLHFHLLGGRELTWPPG